MTLLSAGLLGAAPALPLLANPALSAAFLQLLLQNQAQMQQVMRPLRSRPQAIICTSSALYVFRDANCVVHLGVSWGNRCDSQLLLPALPSAIALPSLAHSSLLYSFALSLSFSVFSCSLALCLSPVSTLYLRALSCGRRSSMVKAGCCPA